MIKIQFELDPREVEEFIRPLPARQQLVYRLAVRGLCSRSGGDRQFKQRIDALMEQFRKDQANKLGEELTASLSARHGRRVGGERWLSGLALEARFVRVVEGTEAVAPVLL
jgi:hypothetical protein